MPLWNMGGTRAVEQLFLGGICRLRSVAELGEFFSLNMYDDVDER